MSFAFKKFSFFTQTEVRGHGFPANSTCHACGSSSLFVGCEGGTIVLLDEAFAAQGALNAFGHRVLFLEYVKERSLLVAVGLEEPGVSSAAVKMWEADRVITAAAAAAAAAASAAAAAAALGAAPSAAAGSGGAASGAPAATVAATSAPATLQPLRSHKLFGGGGGSSSRQPESEVTSLAVDDACGSSQLLLAIGVAAGAVHLLATDASAPRGKLHHIARLSARQEPGELSRVVALAFLRPQQQQQQQQQKHLPALTAAPKTAPRNTSAQSTVTSSTSTRTTPGNDGAGTASGTPPDAATTHGAAGAPGAPWLLVVTQDQTLSFQLGTSTASGTPGETAVRSILDQQGLSSGACSTTVRDLLVVARDDALYEYALDTRAGCTAFEGVKQVLGRAGRHLYVVTDDTPPGGPPTSALRLLDVRNKLVAGTFALPHLTRVVVGPGGLATLSGAGCLHRYTEVPLSTQLESLFKRSLHKLALDLAAGRGADAELLAAIRQRWGDHLYSKGEFEAAMAQYGETIGHLEPSYVIRRFLDAQRIAGLAGYLERLHDARLAGADHTTLLLNCYTKLKDEAKLDAFVRGNGPQSGSSGASSRMASLSAAAAAAARGGGGEGPPPAFDMDAAFKVLRSAGYAAHALAVAERAGQAEWVLDVLVEDLGATAEALAFIGMLPRPQQARALQRHGKRLISSAPDDTTALIMDLCLPRGGSRAAAASPSRPRPLPVGGSSGAAAAVDAPSPPPGGADPAMYVAAVSDFAHLYADAPARLLYLAEFVLFNSGGEAPPGERALYHTLLQLYLADRLVDAADSAGAGTSSGSGGTEVEPQVRHDKARELLARGWQPHMDTPKYDPEHALVLCRQHSFIPGLVLLYDKQHLHREVLAVYMAAQDYGALIAACVQYGDAASGGEPHLWGDALEYLATQPGDCSGPIAELLRHVEAGNLLPPLVVLQTLAKNPNLKVSLVKDYVSRQLAAEVSSIAADREAISRLQSEAATMKAEAAALRSTPHVFQGIRCAASGAALELPVVHFMCGHSFNARALGEGDRECPLCAPEHRRVLDIRRNMRAGALRPDEFFAQLDAAADGFSVVAEHFGRGLMNMTAAGLAASAAAAAAAGAGAPGVGSTPSGMEGFL